MQVTRTGTKLSLRDFKTLQLLLRCTICCYPLFPIHHHILNKRNATLLQLKLPLQWRTQLTRKILLTHWILNLQEINFAFYVFFEAVLSNLVLQHS